VHPQRDDDRHQTDDRCSAQQLARLRHQAAAYAVSLERTESAHRCHDKFRAVRQALQKDRRGRGTTASLGPDELVLAVTRARGALQSAVQRAQDADYQLEATIRTDLLGVYRKPEPRIQIFGKLNPRAVDRRDAGS
jgi:hypothetical protein